MQLHFNKLKKPLMALNWNPFEFGFIVMKIIGVCSKHVTNKNRLFWITTILVFLEVFICLLINVFVTTENFADAVSSVTSIFHCLVKYCWFIYYQPKYTDFFKEDIYTYWNETLFSDKIKEDIRLIKRNLRRLQVTLSMVVVCLATAYSIVPLFNKKRTYIFEISFDVSSFSLKTIIILSQYYLVFVGICSMMGYDNIYISLCYYILIQLKLLREIIGKFGPSTSRATFTTCIRHHHFILSLFSRMKVQYSFIFFIQYSTTVISVCNELLLISGSGYTKYQCVIPVIYLLYIFLQFVVYCVPAEQIGYEVLHLSDEVYSAKWYELSRNYKKEILVIMMATQKCGYFTIGGFMDLNLQASVNVFKAAFSFHALVNNILNQKQ